MELLAPGFGTGLGLTVASILGAKGEERAPLSFYCSTIQANKHIIISLKIKKEWIRIDTFQRIKYKWTTNTGKKISIISL